MINKFFEAIVRQFEYGGQKYAQTKTKEATDVLFDDFGKDWLFGTIAKYMKRYSNVKREKDLLKIACYMFILWLKRGFHLKEKGTKEIINTTVDIKTKYFNVFRNGAKDYIKTMSNRRFTTKIHLDFIYTVLKSFVDLPFEYIYEKELYDIFMYAYYIWDEDIKNKGSDEDVYNEERKKK